MTDRRIEASFLRVATLRRRWALAVFTALVVLAATVPFVVALPDVYRASANILVEGQLFEAFGADAPAVDSRLQAIKQDALSRTRLTELVEQFHLYEAPQRTPLGEATSRLQRDIQIDITSSSQRRGEANTVALKLSYVGSDPVTAANVTNALASFYVAQNDRLRSREATYRSEFLKVSLADAKKKLDAQERRVGTFTSRNVGSLPQQISANQAALVRVSMEIQANTNEQMRQRERRQTLLNQIFDVRANTPGDGDPESLLAQRTKELAALRMNETEDSPNVRAKLREIRTLIDRIPGAGAKAAAATIGQSRLATLQAELADTETRLQKLANEYDELRASMNTYQSRIENAPVRNAELEGIMLDYRAARDLYDSMQKRYDEADIAERAEHSHGIEQFRIVDSAVAPTSPAGPNRVQLLAGGFALAVLLGLGLAFLVDWFDTSFHSIYELRDFTHVPIIASIPAILTRRDRTRRALVVCAVAGVAAVFLVFIGSGAFRYGQRSDVVTRTLLRVG
jgi:polysaccharide chain length determinant protein (PEP-CTERM system associated)